MPMTPAFWQSWSLGRSAAAPYRWPPTQLDLRGVLRHHTCAGSAWALPTRDKYAIAVGPTTRRLCTLARVTRRIRHFLTRLIHSRLCGPGLEALYRRMAQDEEREAEALEWTEATISDVGDIGDIGDVGDQGH